MEEVELLLVSRNHLSNEITKALVLEFQNYKPLQYVWNKLPKEEKTKFLLKLKKQVLKTVEDNS